MAAPLMATPKRQRLNKFHSQLGQLDLNLMDSSFLKELSVRLKLPLAHGNSKSLCWKFIGQLYHAGEDRLVDESRYYCSLCLEAVQATESGHVSQVASFSASTSSGNMILHLSSKHGIYKTEDTTNIRGGKAVDYVENLLETTSDSEPQWPATTPYEFNHDVVLWFCRDLLRFDLLSNEGITAFFAKNLPGFSLPSPSTLSSTVLNDVYLATLAEIKELLAGARSLCLMFDSWTDRYRARTYLVLRVSFVKNWNYNLVTVSCHVLPSNAGEHVADLVLKALKQFVPDVKKVMLTCCHDGAASTIETSRFLNMADYQHCAAHALHLLLTTDSVNTVDGVVCLLQKCREVATSLHFGSTVLDEEPFSLEERISLEKLRKAMADAVEVVELDDQFPLVDGGQTAEPAYAENADKNCRPCGNLSKLSVPTRWTVTLTILEAILDLQTEVQNALKRVGRFELCFSETELSLMSELRQLLSTFKLFADIMSTSLPILSIIPMMKMKIRKLCVVNANDHPHIKSIKENISKHVERRLPESTTSQIHKLLDPETKDLIPRQEASKLLEDAIASAMAQQFIEKSDIKTDYVATGPENKKMRLRLELIDEMRESSTTANDGASSAPSAEIAIEVTKYLTMRMSRSVDDVLGFWRANADSFPTISQLAELYLSISAASVPVDCMFSTTGLIMNGRRSQIGPDKINRVSFIHDNLGHLNNRISCSLNWSLAGL